MNAAKVSDGIIGTAALLGILCMIAGPVVAFAGRHLPLGSIEFPLVDVQAVDADAHGNVVLSDGYYGRIQLYDSSGRFTRGWPADAGGGGFTTSFLDSGHVASFASRRRSTLVYTLEGDPVSEDARPVSPEERSGRLAIRAPGGSSVSVLRAQVWPTVVRDRGGVRSLVVAQPWYLRLFGPLSVALVFTAALLHHTMAHVRARRSRPV
jgi:hypothetical protein